jgi:acyl-CoA dehydrogenase
VDFEYPQHVQELTERVRRFMEEEVFPAEPIYYQQESGSANRWTWQPILRQLRAKAKAQGLWIFPMDRDHGGQGLSLLEYAPVAEVMSMSPIGAESFHSYSGTVWYAKLLQQYATAPVKASFLRRLL